MEGRTCASFALSDSSSEEGKLEAAFTKIRRLCSGKGDGKTGKTKAGEGDRVLEGADERSGRRWYRGVVRPRVPVRRGGSGGEEDEASGRSWAAVERTGGRSSACILLLLCMISRWSESMSGARPLLRPLFLFLFLLQFAPCYLSICILIIYFLRVIYI